MAYGQSLDNGQTSDIVVKAFGSDGESTSQDLHVNSNSSSLNEAPRLARSNADAVLTWASSSADNSGFGILSQRLSLSNEGSNILTSGDAEIFMEKIDTALQTLNSQRASLGAISNRLDHVVANNTNIATNLTASLGRIQDADYAAESTRLVKSQLIQQSSVAMIAQASASKEDVLRLIEDN